MNYERALVAVPEERVSINSVKVTEDNFGNFLAGFQDYFPYTHWTFAPELNLSTFTPAMQLLQQERKEVYIFPDHIRTQMKEFQNPIFDAKADAERTTTIYYNSANDCFDLDPITHGEYASVVTRTFDNMNSSNFPLIEMHTHPDETLFSPADFARLIALGYDEGRSIVRAVLIMTPDKQILALPNPTTPVLPPEEALEFVDKQNNIFIEEHSAIEKRRIQRITKINQATDSRVSYINKRHEDIISDLIERREFDGAITQSEGAELRAELEIAAQGYINWLDKKWHFLAAKTNISYAGKKNLLANTINLDFIRKLDLQLFISNDMTNFEAFTA